MQDSLNGTDKEQEFVETYERYVDAIYRLCFSFMKNASDAEDAVQDTFFKYYQYSGDFDSESHKKAWLIVTASNRCKDLLKHWWNRRDPLDCCHDMAAANRMPDHTVFDLVMALPVKYKTVVYLYYYEGYNSREIAAMLGKAESTIRSRLQHAKKLLKRDLTEYPDARKENSYETGHETCL